MRERAGQPHGDDLFVSEYVESGFLERISSSQRVFLARTAVLERMSGPLCEAVLGQPGSGLALADLARSNLLLAWAAVLRASFCRHGVRQMRADADEAARRFAAAGIAAPVAQLQQGIHPPPLR